MNGLFRVLVYMNITKWCNPLNAFFILQFNYCPCLTWMCQSRAKNNKINHLHERYFRIIYNDKVSTFEQLLAKGSSVSTYTRNLSFLAEEMFKVVKGLAPTIINDLFPFNRNKQL